jgi:PAS domain S-box-containing protein
MMMAKDDEEECLRAVALQNAQSILLARRRAEEALRKQSEWMRITLASIGDAVISTDAEGRVTFMNSVAEALTGWPQAEAVGRPLPDVLHIVNERTRQPVENPALRAFREGRIVGLASDTVLIARDGTELPIDDSAASMRDESGSPIGAVLVFRDVTARRQAEKDRAHLANIVQSSGDAIVSKTLDGVIRTWNAGAERLFGYSQQEAVGQPITLIIPRERHDEEREILARLCRGERIEHFETVRVAKDGRRLDLSLTVSPIRDGEGRIIGASKVARDISERKRREEELKDADRRKNEFLAMLAHELRNPLAPIRNALQLVRMTCPEPPMEVGQAYDIIERQVEHLVRMVDDLLDVSRITSGKIQLQKERTELAAVVSRAVEGARPLIDARRHTLEVTLSEDVLPVEADPMRLAQVLWNLLNNAAKYTPVGGRIWLTAQKEKGQAVVRVRDTGMGIPPEMLSKVFDLFTQMERTLDRAEGGLGLGLTLVRRLTEMHDGTVEAISAPGQGSEFVVRLPIAADEVPAVKSTAASGAGERAGTAAGRRILVVDDNRDSAESLAMLLRLLGNDVRTAHDGRLALEVAAAYRPDVVLLDIGLPGLDGFEVCRRLRGQYRDYQPLIVAMTGYGQEEDRRRSEEAGFSAHMVKPVDLEALQELLSRPELVRRGNS